MKLVAYGRVEEGANEVPLQTQKHSCQRFCEQEKHAFSAWFEDECQPGTDILERDGFTNLVRHVSNNEVDGLLTYTWDRVSPDPGVVAGLQPLFKVGFNTEVPLYTPEGKVDFTETNDPDKVAVGEAMSTLTGKIDGWQECMRRVRIRDSLNELIERGEGHKIGRPPYGLESDKKRFENRDKVYSYYPDDRGEKDKFKEAVQILNTFAHNGTTPHEAAPPSSRDVGNEHNVAPSVVENIWEYQKTYREVAEEHRDDLVVLF